MLPLLTDLKEIRIIPPSHFFSKYWHAADDAVESKAETGSRIADFRHQNTYAVLFVGCIIVQMKQMELFLSY